MLRLLFILPLVCLSMSMAEEGDAILIRMDELVVPTFKFDELKMVDLVSNLNVVASKERRTEQVQPLVFRLDFHDAATVVDLPLDNSPILAKSPQEPQGSFDLPEMSLRDLTDYVTDVCGLRYLVRGNEIVLRPKEALDDCVTKDHPVLVHGKRLKRGTEKVDVRAFLDLRTSSFPEGTSALYLPAKGVIRVRHSSKFQCEVDAALKSVRELSLFEEEIRYRSLCCDEEAKGVLRAIQVPAIHVRQTNVDIILAKLQAAGKRVAPGTDLLFSVETPGPVVSRFEFFDMPAEKNPAYVPLDFQCPATNLLVQVERLAEQAGMDCGIGGAEGWAEVHLSTPRPFGREYPFDQRLFSLAGVAPENRPKIDADSCFEFIDASAFFTERGLKNPKPKVDFVSGLETLMVSTTVEGHRQMRQLLIQLHNAHRQPAAKEPPMRR